MIPKGSLRLEITESLVMENPEKATAVLRELSEAGAGLALDDFGTGYSSLSYLNQFTFDTIKVDRSFLQASGENGAGSVILRSVVALAHELGKNVVVEGIETEDDVGLLRTIGCEYGQGFYYGEPMSEREALQLLKVARRSEQRKKRRGLLRKRERAVAEETAEAPIEAAASPAPADPAPRTAGRPQAVAAAPNSAARVSPANPAANGAATPVPAAASASPGAGQAPPSQTRSAPPAESAHPPGGPPPLPVIRDPIPPPCGRCHRRHCGPPRQEPRASIRTDGARATPSQRRARALCRAAAAQNRAATTAVANLAARPTRRAAAATAGSATPNRRASSPHRRKASCANTPLRRPMAARRPTSPSCRRRLQRAWPDWRDAAAHLPTKPRPRRPCQRLRQAADGDGKPPVG